MVGSAASESETLIAKHFYADMLGVPFRILLIDSVTVTLDASGKIIDYQIPDSTDLVLATIIQRNTQLEKLSGDEIKFMRKALSLRAKDIYCSIGITREHFSRIENCTISFPASSEKLLRLFFVMKSIRSTKYNESTKIGLLETAFDKILALSALAPTDELTQPAVVTLSRSPHWGWLPQSSHVDTSKNLAV